MDNQRCTFCGTPSHHVCQRCTEPYCSIDCQIQDWPIHKSMCIVMPPLVPTKFRKEMPQGRIEKNYKENMGSMKFRPLKENAGNIRRPRIDENASLHNHSTEAVPTEADDGSIFVKIDNLNKMNLTDSNSNNNEIKNVCATRSIECVKNKSEGDRFRTTSNLNNIKKNTDDLIIKTNINDRIIKCRKSQIMEISVANPPKIVNNPGFKKDYDLITTTPSVVSAKPIINEANQKAITKPKVTTCKPWKIVFPFPDDKSSFQASVQYVNESDKIIWLTSSSLEHQANNLLKEINTNLKHAAKATINDINIDDVVSALYIDGIYYRAIILENINANNEVHVRLVDYGNDFLTHIDQLKLPIPIMKNLNSYAFCCRYDKPTDIGKILNIRVIGKESDNIYKIEEINNTVQNSMNKQLIPFVYEIIDSNDNLNLTKEKGSEQTEKDLEKRVQQIEKLYQLNDIEVIPIEIGNDVKIIILDSSNLKCNTITAAVCDLDFIRKYYTEYQAKINDYCVSENNEYAPKENELCFTIFDEDGVWYRAICHKVMPNEKFQLQFIDFGNTILVNKSQIRKFHKDFSFKCIANTCSLDGLPPTLTDEQLNKLSFLCPNAALTVNEVKVVNGKYIIRIDGI